MNVRRAPLLLLFLIACAVQAQDADPKSSRPDVTVVIREHATSADMVEITMSRADYPTELLRQQMEYLGSELNSMPRGLDIQKIGLDPTNKELQFVKARFAIDGILDKTGHRLNIQPLLRAFAGAADPYTVQHLLIIFDGEKPSARTVKKHVSDAVEAEANFVSAPAEIEYHVTLKSQDRNKITFPDQAPDEKPGKENTEKASGPSMLFIGAIAIAALAVGALVYLTLLRRGNPPRP